MLRLETEPAGVAQPKRKKPAQRSKPKAAKRPWIVALPPCRKAALFCASVAVGFLVLSISHLTVGIARLTGDHILMSLLLAGGIDLAIVAAELSGVVAANRPVLARIWPFAFSLITGMLTISGIMNILSYVEHHDTWRSFEFAMSVVFGVAVPLSIYALFQIAAKLWLYGSKRKEP